MWISPVRPHLTHTPIHPCMHTSTQVFDNPLQDPPMSSIASSMRQEILWILKEKYQQSIKGLPPSVVYHASGVGGEIIQPSPDFDREMQEKVGKEPCEKLDLRNKGKEQGERREWCVYLE